MPTAKQLRSAAAGLRSEGHHGAAGHLDTHADVIDKAKAHKALENHYASLDEEEQAKFAWEDLLGEDDIRLVMTDIRVGPLAECADPLLVGHDESVTKARDLVGLEPYAYKPAGGVLLEASAIDDSATVAALERLTAATEAQTAALLQALTPSAP